MKKQTLALLTLALCIAAGPALAAGPGEPPGPPGPMAGPAAHGPVGGPMRGPGIPPPELLATIDGLGASQQADIRKILREQRDALDTLRTRTRGEHEAIEERERGDRERIEDQTAQKLRTALGEDGYRAYARWLVQRGPTPMPPRPAPRGDRADAPPPPPEPGTP